MYDEDENANCFFVCGETRRIRENCFERPKLGGGRVFVEKPSRIDFQGLKLYIPERVFTLIK